MELWGGFVKLFSRLPRFSRFHLEVSVSGHDRLFDRTYTGILLATGLVVGCSSTAPFQPSRSNSPVVTVAVTPGTVMMLSGSSQNFAATVQGSSNTNVSWSIQEGAIGGTVTNAGVYQAPVGAGVYHLIATAQADPTRSAMALVYVAAGGAAAAGTSFMPTGAMSFARLEHTATLLPSGKVLIVGGGWGTDLIDGFEVVEEAELFDPATGLFTPGGVSAHDGHAATLLTSGDVLIAGGEVGWSGGFPIVSGSSQLYRAASGNFELTGGMLVGRECHQATLLNDGRVLISGGLVLNGVNWQPISGTEFYDPATGNYSAGPNMNTARGCHTATLLPNGKVLITGNWSQSGANTAELFDPSTGRFSPTGDMITGRAWHTATLLPNGKVLITGGSGLTGAPEELYDPASGTFTATAHMNYERLWHTATLLTNGTVLISGGYIIHVGSTATTEIYDPATGTFTFGPSLGQGRFYHTATLLRGGNVLFAGGASSPDDISITPLTSAEIYH
jgi:hypothetical protein